MGAEDRAREAGEFCGRETRVLLDHEGLVVGECNAGRRSCQGEKLVARKEGRRLARIEDEGDAVRDKGLGVCQKRASHAGGEDSADYARVVRPGKAICVRHGAGTEGGQLIAVPVGGDHALRRPFVRHDGHAVRANALTFKMPEIVVRIPADGGPDKGISAKLLQTVGDVCGAAAVGASHGVRLKRDVESVERLCPERVGKASLVREDRVVGDGAGNDDGHGFAKRQKALRRTAERLGLKVIEGRRRPSRRRLTHRREAAS